MNRSLGRAQNARPSPFRTDVMRLRYDDGHSRLVGKHRDRALLNPGLVPGGRAEVTAASFQGSPPTLGSIVSRSRTASRTAFGRRLRRSPAAILDPARDRERFGLYRVGGEGVVQRFQLGAGWHALVGVWGTLKVSAVCPQAEAPHARTLPHPQGRSPRSGAGGTSIRVGKSPHRWGNTCGNGPARR